MGNKRVIVILGSFVFELAAVVSKLVLASYRKSNAFWHLGKKRKVSETKNNKFSFLYVTISMLYDKVRKIFTYNVGF